MRKRPVIVAVVIIILVSLVSGICFVNSDLPEKKDKVTKPEVTKEIRVSKDQSEKKDKVKAKAKDVKPEVTEQKEAEPKKKVIKPKVHKERKESPVRPETVPEEQISASSVIFYPVKHYVKYPDKEIFKDKYKYAVEVYNYAVKGKPMGEFTFKNADEMRNFQKKVRKHILSNSGVQLLQSFETSYVIETGKDCRMKPFSCGHEEYAELVEVETFAINHFGNGGITDLDLINNLNRWLRYNTSYDSNKGELSYGQLGIVRNSKAVCNGYAEFVQSVCDTYGVPCEKVTGTVERGLHAWNRVKVGGTWYYLDTTWNVCLNSDEYYLSKNLWSDHKLQ